MPSSVTFRVMCEFEALRCLQVLAGLTPELKCSCIPGPGRLHARPGAWGVGQRTQQDHEGARLHAPSHS